MIKFQLSCARSNLWNFATTRYLLSIVLFIVCFPIPTFFPILEYFAKGNNTKVWHTVSLPIQTLLKNHVLMVLMYTSFYKFSLLNHLFCNTIFTINVLIAYTVKNYCQFPYNTPDSFHLLWMGRDTVYPLQKLLNWKQSVIG